MKRREPDAGAPGPDVLAEVEAKRGYLLPYHRMLAATDPGLLADYDRYYESLTLAPRSFAPAERESVWAALLVAAREAHGQIHMRRAVRAGLDPGHLADAVALAAVVEALQVLAFASDHWAEWVPEAETAARYLALWERARGTVAPAVAEVIGTVCHAARRTQAGMRIHLPRAFAAGATVAQMSEGLSYLLLPCGGPTLIDAVDAWRQDAEANGYPGPY